MRCVRDITLRAFPSIIEGAQDNLRCDFVLRGLRYSDLHESVCDHVAGHCWHTRRGSTGALSLLIRFKHSL